MGCPMPRLLVLAVCLSCAACGGSSGPEGRSTEAAPAATAASSPADTSAPEPATVADVFPDGPGKSLVLDNCASCHNVACSAIGQRTAERWDGLKKTHAEHAPAVDLETVFAYLKANFDSTKPEPRVPPRFLEGGCSPF